MGTLVIYRVDICEYAHSGSHGRLKNGQHKDNGYRADVRFEDSCLARRVGEGVSVYYLVIFLVNIT